MVNRSGSSNQVFRKKTNSSCKVPPLFFIWLMLTISIYFFWSGRCGTITGKPLEEVFHQTLGLGIRTEQIPEDRHGLFEVFQLVSLWSARDWKSILQLSIQDDISSIQNRTRPFEGSRRAGFLFLIKKIYVENSGISGDATFEVLSLENLHTPGGKVFDFENKVLILPIPMTLFAPICTNMPSQARNWEQCQWEQAGQESSWPEM